MKKLCDAVQSVGVFTYLGDRVSASEGCIDAELLYDRGFSLRLNGSVYMSYTRAAILY